jgi:hypothetical protein
MVTWSDIESFAVALGGVEPAVSYGEPSLKIGRALLARFRVSDNSVVLKSVNFDERDHLISAYPDIFFVEDHYLRHDIVLARLEHADLDDLAPYIRRTWARLAGGRARNTGNKRMHPL